MAWKYLLMVSLSLCVHGAPPSPGLGHYRSSPIRQSSSSPHQPGNSLEYYFNDPSAAQFYNQVAQKQISVNQNQNQDTEKLESLDPKTEVEYLPGVQPQQPPQQSPVSPNIPGLLPGQQVYIVHMPVPGYRPGSIGGYQPVYIVGAGSAENTNACAANGYQNTILVDQSGQPVYSPLGYQRGLAPNLQPGLHPQYGYLHTDPTYAYQQGLQGQSPNQVNPGPRHPLRFAQLVTVQGQHPLPPSIHGQSNEASAPNRVSEQSSESNESSEVLETRNKGRTTALATEDRSKM